MTTNNSGNNPHQQTNYNNWYPAINGQQWITVTIPSIAAPIAISAPITEAEPVAKKKNKDGETCKKCKEFYPFAEPNQEDGTLVCYSCRHGY